MSNFMFLADPLAARVRSALDAASLQAVQVLKAPQYTSVDGELPAPCVFVLLDAWDIVENSAQGARARISQSWQVIVTVRHGASASAQAAITQSGAITDLLLSALMGWHPPGCSAPLQLVSPPKPAIENGCHHLAIALQAEFMQRAS